MRPQIVSVGRRFRNIKAWQRIDDLAVLVYDRTRTFPRDEQYGLTLQMRRAAVSAAANIVEGSARRSRKEYLQFLSIAKGSLTELSYYVYLTKRLGYISDAQFTELDEDCEEASRTLYGLMQAVSKENRGRSLVSGLQSHV